MPASQRPLHAVNIFRIALLVLFASHFEPPKASAGNVDLYFASPSSDAPGNPVIYVAPGGQCDNSAAIEEFARAWQIDALPPQNHVTSRVINGDCE